MYIFADKYLQWTDEPSPGISAVYVTIGESTLTDTIAAIATGGAISAIGIIRISGNDAIFVADRMFRAANGKRLANAENRRMYYGELLGEDGRLIDLCLCMISRGPDSYTGEDTAEIHCHGSPVVLSEVLRLLFSHGVRQAQAGEFTKRAFLNGRMDLTQAEAVIDLIEAETPASALNAACQLRGAVGIKLDSVYNSLVDVMAHFHAVIDYPDEDIDEFEMQGYLSALRESEEELSRLLSTHERGRVLREGVPTAIIGRPNTGKSSLLNALLGYDRAIVTDISGTTRDTIEEKVFFGGLLLRLIDTAGLRKTGDTLEKLGVERTIAALQNAGLVLLVLDGSEPLKDEDSEALHRIPDGAPTLVIVNKSDLPAAIGQQELQVFLNQRDLPALPGQHELPALLGQRDLPALLGQHELPVVIDQRELPAVSDRLGHSRPGFDCCRVSALTGDGLDVLDDQIKKMFPGLIAPPEGEIISNRRQAEAISRAKESILLAIAAINEAVTPDAVLTDIEEAITAIGEVTGKTMREDVITRIFERFCVGK